MATIESVRQAAATYQKQLVKVEERREVWYSAVKMLIASTLKQICQGLAVDCVVLETAPAENQGGVCLKMHPTSSGIVVTSGNRTTGYPRHGGYFVYWLVPNGMVQVSAAPPHIRELEDKPEPTKFRELEPSQITEAVILEDAERFFKMIAVANETHTANKIGFAANFFSDASS